MYLKEFRFTKDLHRLLQDTTTAQILSHLKKVEEKPEIYTLPKNEDEEGMEGAANWFDQAAAEAAFEKIFLKSEEEEKEDTDGREINAF